MREFELKTSLQATLAKLAKKDKVAYEQIQNKILEILSCQDVSRYNNLHSPLQQFQRVHIKGSFVLIFRYLRAEDKVVFYDYDHHDNIYRT